MEAFTTKGHWWLPGNRPDSAISGILTFDPRGRSELELFGSFSDKVTLGQNPIKERIILGVGERGQAVTLVDNETFGPVSAYSDYEWKSTRYFPRLAFQGHLFEQKEEIRFERMLFDYYGLNAWASTNQPWKPVDLNDPESVRSAFENEILESVQTDEFCLDVVRGHSWIMHTDELEIKRGAWIEIRPNSPWGYEEYLRRIFQFQVFLSLATGIPTWPMSINIPSPFKANSLISFHCAPVTDFRETNFQSKSYMVFALQDIRPKLARCLKNWFANSEKLDKVFKLYNRAVSKEIDLEDQLLTLSKAVEVYHRQTKSANRHSLGRRLEYIRETYHHLNNHLFGEFEQFSKYVVNTRNYLTHYDETEIDMSFVKLDGQSLFAMCERLRFIVEICLLSELDLNKDELQNAVKNIGRINPLSHALHPPKAES